MTIAAIICEKTKYMFHVRGGHVRGRGKKGVRRTSLSSSEEVIVVVSFNIFHLCGMVSRDTGTFDRQSENTFCRKNNFNSHHKKALVSLRQNRRHASYYSRRHFLATDVAKNLRLFALLRVDWVS
jgi:hypothetical protein